MQSPQIAHGVRVERASAYHEPPLHNGIRADCAVIHWLKSRTAPVRHVAGVRDRRIDTDAGIAPPNLNQYPRQQVVSRFWSRTTWCRSQVA